MAFGDKIDQRKQNKLNHVIDIFRKTSPLSKAHARELSGYSMDTIITIFETLLQEGLIIPGSGVQKGKGRRAQFYTLDKTSVVYYGVTFNQSGIYSSIVSFSYHLLRNYFTPLKLGIKKEDFIQAFYHHIEHDASLTRDYKRLRIGCSLPGDVDMTSGTLKSYSLMPFIQGMEAAQVLERSFPGRPVTVSHNIHSMLSYIIHENGTLKRYKNILFISARSGTGSGLIYNGSIATSRGEFGHIRVTDRGDRCVCGREGCLDCYFSYRAFVELLNETGGGSEREGETGAGPLEILARLYGDGSSPVKERLDEKLRLFAAALINTVNISGPDLIILTGELFSVYGDPVPAVRKAVDEVYHDSGIVSHYREADLVFRNFGTEIAAAGVCYEMIWEEWDYSPE